MQSIGEPEDAARRRLAAARRGERELSRNKNRGSLLGPLMRRHISITALFCALAGLAPAAATAESTTALRRVLVSGMGAAGSGSGAYVVDLTERKVLFNSRADTRRILASNTKLFTTTAALERFGAGGTLETRVVGDGALDVETGRWEGDLYLKGGGDPTFGSGTFIARAYGTGADIEVLVTALEAAG